ncbi:hypothetical protein GE061_007847 [Apolygus lucorum]|uniref:Uncharacterized protein n=1 Tax=Apolygus lucorum TaxID=248454 RepID=A0A8S9WLX6_APOLU|nr:hypothetical protein GE061_007847 [Apolygus lucorum]
MQPVSSERVIGERFVLDYELYSDGNFDRPGFLLECSKRIVFTVKCEMTERAIPHIRDIFGEELPDSAMGTSCEEEPPTPPEDTRKKKKKKGEQDLKHLERHLSMKKTIRCV